VPSYHSTSAEFVNTKYQVLTPHIQRTPEQQWRMCSSTHGPVPYFPPPDTQLKMVLQCRQRKLDCNHMALLKEPTSATPLGLLSNRQYRCDRLGGYKNLQCTQLYILWAANWTMLSTEQVHCIMTLR